MIPFPQKKYSIIYADPPWHYNETLHNPRDNKLTSHASWHYPTMKTKEICQLPVQDITESDCLLFLWTGSPVLDEAIEVGKAWGFQFKTIAFVWDKEIATPGNYTMAQCEICLQFKRGKIPQPRGKRNIRQLVRIKRGEHSVKPWQVKHRITEMFPEQSKIELFARPLPLLANLTDGWDYWGNEVSP